MEKTDIDHAGAGGVALLMALGMAVSESLVARTGVACRDDTN